MTEPLVSVVLPVFNGEDFIEEAVTSLLAQDVALEIVISDDRSTDRTIAILEGLRDPRIRILRNETKGGQFVNFNRAIAQARGRFIQCFSHDDVAHPGFLKAQLAGFDHAPSVGLVYASCNIIDPTGRRLTVNDDENTPLHIDFPTYLLISSRHGSVPPSISSVMVRREVIDAVGAFDERFAAAGDLEFFNRVAEAFTFARNRTCSLDVRVHGGSVTLNPDSPLRYMREEILIMPFYQRHLSPADYRRMMALRSRNRGADHARQLLKFVAHGDLARAAQGWSALSQLHSAPACLFHALTRRRGRHAA